MQILITRCSDPRLWYADKVGQTVPYLRRVMEGYLSREPNGFVNVVFYGDGELQEPKSQNAKRE